MARGKIKAKEKAVKKLKQLINVNYTDKHLKIKIAYDNCLSKPDTNLK